MRRNALPGLVFALVVVGSFLLHHAAMDPREPAIREALEGAPIPIEQRERVIDDVLAAADEVGESPPRQDVSDVVLEGARRYELEDGRAVVDLSYGEGAFYLTDRTYYAHWNGEAEALALERTFDGGGPVGVAGDVVAVSWCEGGEGALPVRVREHAPGRPAARFDAVTDVDLDLATGDVAISGNGDGAVQAVVAVPPGAYRARLSLGEADDCMRQSFALDLWPRRADAPPRVVVAAPTR